MTTTYSLYAFLNAYEAYDGDNLDAFISEWSERLGMNDHDDLQAEVESLRQEISDLAELYY